MSMASAVVDSGRHSDGGDGLNIGTGSACGDSASEMSWDMQELLMTESQVEEQRRLLEQFQQQQRQRQRQQQQHHHLQQPAMSQPRQYYDGMPHFNDSQDSTEIRRANQMFAVCEPDRSNTASTIATVGTVGVLVDPSASAPPHQNVRPRSSQGRQRSNNNNNNNSPQYQFLQRWIRRPKRTRNSGTTGAPTAAIAVPVVAPAPGNDIARRRGQQSPRSNRHPIAQQSHTNARALPQSSTAAAPTTSENRPSRSTNESHNRISQASSEAPPPAVARASSNAGINKRDIGIGIPVQRLSNHAGDESNNTEVSSEARLRMMGGIRSQSTARQRASDDTNRPRGVPEHVHVDDPRTRSSPRNEIPPPPAATSPVATELNQTMMESEALHPTQQTTTTPSKRQYRPWAKMKLIKKRKNKNKPTNSNRNKPAKTTGNVNAVGSNAPNGDNSVTRRREQSSADAAPNSDCSNMSLQALMSSLAAMGTSRSSRVDDDNTSMICSAGVLRHGQNASAPYASSRNEARSLDHGDGISTTGRTVASEEERDLWYAAEMHPRLQQALLDWWWYRRHYRHALVEYRLRQALHGTSEATPHRQFLEGEVERLAAARERRTNNLNGRGERRRLNPSSQANNLPGIQENDAMETNDANADAMHAAQRSSSHSSQQPEKDRKMLASPYASNIKQQSTTFAPPESQTPHGEARQSSAGVYEGYHMGNDSRDGRGAAASQQSIHGRTSASFRRGVPVRTMSGDAVSPPQSPKRLERRVGDTRAISATATATTVGNEHDRVLQAPNAFVKATTQTTTTTTTITLTRGTTTTPATETLTETKMQTQTQTQTHTQLRSISMVVDDNNSQNSSDNTTEDRDGTNAEHVQSTKAAPRAAELSEYHVQHDFDRPNTVTENDHSQLHHPSAHHSPVKMRMPSTLQMNPDEGSSPIRQRFLHAGFMEGPYLSGLTPPAPMSGVTLPWELNETPDASGIEDNEDSDMDDHSDSMDLRKGSSYEQHHQSLLQTQAGTQTQAGDRAMLPTSTSTVSLSSGSTSAVSHESGSIHLSIASDPLSDTFSSSSTSSTLEDPHHVALGGRNQADDQESAQPKLPGRRREGDVEARDANTITSGDFLRDDEIELLLARLGQQGEPVEGIGQNFSTENVTSEVLVPHSAVVQESVPVPMNGPDSTEEEVNSVQIDESVTSSIGNVDLAMLYNSSETGQGRSSISQSMSTSTSMHTTVQRSWHSGMEGTASTGHRSQQNSHHRQRQSTHRRRRRTMGLEDDPRPEIALTEESSSSQADSSLLQRATLMPKLHQQISSSSDAMSTAGLDATFQCRCCFDTYPVRPNGIACDNIQCQPHVFCRKCIQNFIWNSRETTAFRKVKLLQTNEDGMRSSQAAGSDQNHQWDPICQIGCFQYHHGDPKKPCPGKIQVHLAKLFDRTQMEHIVSMINARDNAISGGLARVDQTERRQSTQLRHHEDDDSQGGAGVDTNRRTPNPMSSAIQQMQHAMKEAMTQVRVRTCPSCQQSFVKEGGGCNKMICPMCQTASCFCCRKVVSKDGYNHFTNLRYYDKKDLKLCPLWTDDDIDLARDQSRMRQEVFSIANRVCEEAFSSGSAQPPLPKR